ncbi:hypothetical protein [Azospirillum agricola]|uniref:hypothetical protein n=1 Tax=Azospirillum agricola TaxID=1720247 RepID=UPI000A0F13D9|nr:hypothetical protein [Azospirillum agricola]SMH60372.1 hypothetical protein SAMN02982994_5449 [Azospirillum lipoferum]
MTARFAAPLSALLLLSVAVPSAAGVQVAELVPVEPTLPPAAYYGVPATETEVVGPAGRPGAPAARSAPAKDGPAELEDGWEGGAAKDKDGKFAYCVIEGGFTSGHVLMIARSQKGETNIGIGIPGAQLPPGEKWPVKVEVDGKLKRERVAIAPQPDMLVVSNGKDEELVTALMNGKELVVASASDRIAFALKGTKKVLTDLKTCVDKGGNVPPIKTSTGTKPPVPPQARLPEGLAGLLASAGVRDAELVPMDKVPADQRPADVAWRFGPIVGGIRERVVGDGAKLDELSGAFAEAMKSRCEGTGTISLNASEQAGTVTLRTGAVDCAMPQGTLHVSLTFLLSQGRLFTVLFHEAGEPDVALADKVRDNLAQVLRKAGTAAAAPAAAASSAPASAAPAAATAPAPETPPAATSAPAKP